LPRLGLDSAQWSTLAEELDAVIHAGASVNWINVYKSLREPNVLGTLALLELAMARRRKPFHYVSTISTAPANGDEATSLPFDQAVLGSAYGLSKWIAEGIVRRAGEAGHPVTIYRPGMITGQSARGIGNALVRASARSVEDAQRRARPTLHLAVFVGRAAVEAPIGVGQIGKPGQQGRPLRRVEADAILILDELFLDEHWRTKCWVHEPAPARPGR